MPEGKALSLFVGAVGTSHEAMAACVCDCDDVPCNTSCDCYDCVVN
jgi:hypothetical protein